MKKIIRNILITIFVLTFSFTFLSCSNKNKINNQIFQNLIESNQSNKSQKDTSSNDTVDNNQNSQIDNNETNGEEQDINSESISLIGIGIYQYDGYNPNWQKYKNGINNFDEIVSVENNKLSTNDLYLALMSSFDNFETANSTNMSNHQIVENNEKILMINMEIILETEEFCTFLIFKNKNNDIIIYNKLYFEFPETDSITYLKDNNNFIFDKVIINVSTNLTTIK